MTRVGSNSLYGTVNLLILKAVSRGPHHGLGIARRIRDASNEALQIEEGALYPALQRLERDGMLTARWGLSESNRRAKYYEITPKGERVLRSEVDAWIAGARAICEVLEIPWPSTT